MDPILAQTPWQLPNMATALGAAGHHNLQTKLLLTEPSTVIFILTLCYPPVPKGIFFLT